MQPFPIYRGLRICAYLLNVRSCVLFAHICVFAYIKVTRYEQHDF